MRPLHIVILAAGKGTRMKSDQPKVLHELAGRPLIGHVLEAASCVNPATVTVVVGHQAQLVRQSLQGCEFVVQEPQLGTGHALLQAEQALKDASGDVLLLSGDVPMLRGETIQALVETHRAAKAAATVLTAEIDDPAQYGRVVREDGRIARIVEFKDASESERRLNEINSGVYVFDVAPLFAALKQIGSANAQGEYYLPDLVALYRRQGLVVETMKLPDATEIRGVNSRAELAALARDVRRRTCDRLMAAGVTIEDPSTTYIDDTVEIGADTIVHPMVRLEGQTRIGARCVIHSGTRLTNAIVADEVLIRDHCVITDATIEAKAIIGPFAHIRPESAVGAGAHVGNFVELKKTSMGAGAKANHLAYLGDATIGDNANIGAGTITCNYDGVDKHRTIVGAGAFIGSDTQLVAPVSVGDGAYVGAGSSITEDVPDGALAIARARQVNKEGWVGAKTRQKRER